MTVMDLDQSSERIHREIIRLCHAGLNSATLRFEVLNRLRQAVMADAWC